MVIAIMVSLFVVAVLGVAAYGLVRPWTHIHYHHTNEKLWTPLD